LLQLFRCVGRVQHDHFSTTPLQVPHVMVGQSTVEGESLRQLALDVLELLSTETKRVQTTRNLVGRAHSLEDYATGLVCVTRTALRDNGSRLAERLPDDQ